MITWGWVSERVGGKARSKNQVNCNTITSLPCVSKSPAPSIILREVSIASRNMSSGMSFLSFT